MPSSIHSIEVNVSLQEAWEFVRSLKNWAPLIPGYISHELIHEREAKWEFLGGFGFMKKKVSLKVDDIVIVESSMITFELTGIEDNFEGSGYFQIEKIDEQRTLITGNLDISAGGFMGAMVNNVLKTFVPKTTTEFVIFTKMTLERGI